jgi:hypothetical protein
LKRKIYIWLIIASVLSILIAFLLAGGGHGWVSVFFFSFLPLLITPLTVYAYINSKKLFSIIIIGLYLLAMYILYFMTLEEGEVYFERVFKGVTGLVILFFTLWLSPLLLNIYNLFRNKQNL